MFFSKFLATRPATVNCLRGVSCSNGVRVLAGAVEEVGVLVIVGPQYDAVNNTFEDLLVQGWAIGLTRGDTTVLL